VSEKNISYSTCLSSDQKVTETDTIEIEYLGILKTGENILIQRPADSAILSYMSEAIFGKFNISDSLIPNSLKKIATSLNKNSEAIVQFDFTNSPSLTHSFIVTIYLTAETDSISAINHIKETLKTISYDSISYISKKSAIEKYKSVNEDTAWISLLEQNPLPVSADIYISSKDYSRQIGDSIRSLLVNSPNVSDIALPSDAMLNFYEGHKNRYLIRIRS